LLLDSCRTRLVFFLFSLRSGTRATLPVLLLATFPHHLATGGIPPPARSLVPPGWAPSYDLAASTIAMPCNDSGLMLDQRAFRHWGVLSWDWSNGKDLYIWQIPEKDMSEPLFYN
jgi:hypothetical protein